LYRPVLAGLWLWPVGVHLNLVVPIAQPGWADFAWLYGGLVPGIAQAVTKDLGESGAHGPGTSGLLVVPTAR
jgi:hypothetical protein